MTAPKREPCGCEIVESTTRYGHEIAYCPVHAAGPKAVALLRATAGTLHAAAEIRALLRTLAPQEIACPVCKGQGTVASRDVWDPRTETHTTEDVRCGRCNGLGVAPADGGEPDHAS